MHRHGRTLREHRFSISPEEKKNNARGRSGAFFFFFFRDCGHPSAYFRSRDTPRARNDAQWRARSKHTDTSLASVLLIDPIKCNRSGYL